MRDRAAFARVFAFYGPRVKAYLRRLGADDAVAEDLTQDVMLSIWRRAQQFDRSRAALSTWIFTIARNKRIDALRRERRPDFDPEDPALVGDSELAPRGDRYAEAEQARREVMRAVAALPAEQAQLLRIFYFEEKPHSAIAEELGLPLGTVKSRLRLALGQAAAIAQWYEHMTEHRNVDDLLIAHAAGKLPEPVGLAVATHLALNPAARARYRRYEAVGGALLDELEPVDLAPDAWGRLEQLLDDQEVLEHDCRAVAPDLILPHPLRDYLPGPFDSCAGATTVLRPRSSCRSGPRAIGRP